MRYLFAAAALLAAACGDSTAPDVIPELLAGNWVAEPACLPNCGFTITPVASPGDSLNVVSGFGVTMDLSLTRAGRIEIRALNAGSSVEPIRGEVTVEGQTLILRDTEGSVDTVDFQVNATRLQVAFRQQVLLEGAPSRVSGVFLRR